MKRSLSNENGLTLVEILAGIVISTIILFIVFNIMLTIQNKYTGQSEEAGNLFDVTLVAKEITKEIRKYPSDISTPNNHTIIFNENGPNKIEFKLVDTTLQRNDKVFIDGISSFHVEKKIIDNNEKIVLRINSNIDSSKNIDTEIVIR